MICCGKRRRSMVDDMVWDIMTSSWMTRDEWHAQNDARDAQRVSDQASYVRQQFAKLGNSARYQVKIRGQEGETHWIRISPQAVGQILWTAAQEES
jgi:hypothetical protein